jgi:hypothetical protein
MKVEIEDILDRNLSRADNLVKIFRERAPKDTRDTEHTDILRAATVFLHASLDDFLRSIAAWKLPLASKNVLKDIPLLGMNKGEKFSLGDLSDHRDQQVAKLIEASVRKQLERSSYNNIFQVKKLLHEINIRPKRVEGTFKILDELMKRRHQIVHRVDRKSEFGRAVRLKETDVTRWIRAVKRFTGTVLNEVSE